jgi:hypothetical protein
VNRLLTNALHISCMRGLLTSLAFCMLGATIAPALAVGGAYRTIAAQNAAACARACADDGLCIAWALTGSTCSLSAIAPSAWPQDTVELGLSARAPGFASLPQRPQTLTPPPQAPPSESEEAERDEIGFALLGGRGDGDLRPRLGSRN